MASISRDIPLYGASHSERGSEVNPVFMSIAGAVAVATGAVFLTLGLLNYFGAPGSVGFIASVVSGGGIVFIALMSGSSFCVCRSCCNRSKYEDPLSDSASFEVASPRLTVTDPVPDTYARFQFVQEEDEDEDIENFTPSRIQAQPAETRGETRQSAIDEQPAVVVPVVPPPAQPVVVPVAPPPIDPFPFFDLPKDICHEVLSFSNFAELLKMQPGSKAASEIVKKAILDKARRYGYVGKEYLAAKGYIEQLLTEYKALSIYFVGDNVLKKVDIETKLKSIKLEADHIFHLYAHCPDAEVYVMFTQYLLSCAIEGRVRPPKLANDQSDGPKALLKMVQKGAYLPVALLLELGADPNIPAENGSAPLHYAAQLGYFPIMRLLLGYGAKVNGPGLSGISALGFATCEVNNNVPKSCISETVSLLLAHKADPNLPNDPTIDKPLHFAVDQGDVELTRLLLENGADVNILDSKNDTPLVIAVGSRKDRTHKMDEENTRKIVELLLDSDMDPNQAGANGSKPLHFAAQRAMSTVVSILIDAGARVDDRGWGNLAPINFLVSNRTYGNLRTIMATLEILLERGADANVRDPQNGRHALHEAAARGYTDMVDLLLQNNANINDQDLGNATPLATAVRAKKVETVRLLTAYGADLDPLIDLIKLVPDPR